MQKFILFFFLFYIRVSLWLLFCYLRSILGQLTRKKFVLAISVPFLHIVDINGVLLTPRAKFSRCTRAEKDESGGCDRGRWPRSGWSLSGRFLWGMNPTMEEELGILRGAVMCVSASEGCVRASTWRTIVLHPPRETENVSRLTELKQRVGHVVREGQPLSSRFTRFCFSLSLSSFPLVSSPSRVTLRTTNSRSPTVKGLTSLRLIVEH